jgi:hypothetical protein
VRLAAAFLAWLVAGGSPAAARGGPALRLVLLPIEAVNLEASEAARHEALLARALERRRDLALARAQRVTAACAADLGCLRARAREAGAARVLALRAGRLGDTVVLRLALYDAERNARVGTWQEVLAAATPATISRALERMIASALPPPPPPAAVRWYTRWWVWTAAGIVVAGAVTAAVLATRPREHFDIVLVPPKL